MESWNIDLHFVVISKVINQLCTKVKLWQELDWGMGAFFCKFLQVLIEIDESLIQSNYICSQIKHLGLTPCQMSMK